LVGDVRDRDLIGEAKDSLAGYHLTNRSLVLWEATVNVWNGTDTSNWISVDMLSDGWRDKLDLPKGWNVVAWIPDEQPGPTISRLQAITLKAASNIPTDSDWWRDFGITTAVVGTTVGTATFGCAVISTPGGPVVMALAGGACGTLAAHGGAALVSEGYAWAGETLDESAFRTGEITGSIVGSIGGSAVVSQYLQWQQFRHYKNFAGYAKEARSLTTKTLRVTPGSVANLRANGYDVDHVIPVKCGWKFGISAAEISSMSNLHALPSSVNRSIGAKGC